MPVFTVSNRLCVIMVGLPARGKSFISQKIVRYLSWLSVPSKCFNVGHYRRLMGTVHPKAAFFDPDNEEGLKLREMAAERALEDMLEWFTAEEGIVAILDATNTTRARREWVARKLRANSIEPMFLESWCDDQDLILRNVVELKSTSPDYEGVESEVAIHDFLARIKKYEKIYQPLDESHDKELTFVRLINVSQQVIINRIESYLESRIVFYIMNLHIKPRYIWLSRHGESIYNVEKKIGGDSHLSPRGLQYARKLPEIVKQSAGDANLTTWISTLVRTGETAQFLPYKQLQWKALDELDAGVCDGMTYYEIQEKYPEDFKARDDDKFEYRYRGGESYRDVIVRLEPVIMELERQENILIITHQAVLRCIYAYFMNVPQEESPWVSIPLHTLIKLEPRAYGTRATRIKADIPAVSTYKERGSSQLKDPQ
ncbi:HHL291Cp [Eremothecium sinecaudum]|uniref:fructose-2,6-bisphosphate 2-phosphatase n=1 Tax=Eremothecium sinecaudum TaxID=45286 RepID=A0A0X8HW20_9SACH|nr:HHL291Cp [Eremothecium sinecaudum]AMD22479.1 HHL291Cp [Eremothecium sinecaudum]